LTQPGPKNLSTSVRQKLANIARERNVDFGLILVKYGLERSGDSVVPSTAQRAARLLE
jgi:hypothetical protein